jgi:hypothetical protein
VSRYERRIGRGAAKPVTDRKKLAKAKKAFNGRADRINATKSNDTGGGCAVVTLAVGVAVAALAAWKGLPR